MSKQVPTQLVFGLGILVIGAAIVGGEYGLVQWYPGHKQAVIDRTLKQVPFTNDGLGVDMMIAKGIYGKVEPFSGGVRIFSPMLEGKEPSITITSQPNPDQRGEFTPQETAIWQSDGVQHNLPRYQFEYTRINDRDAVLIWQYKDHAMQLTERVISPDRIVEAVCTVGSAEESLYMRACDESLRTLKVAGPPSPQPVQPAIQELPPPTVQMKQ